MSLITPGNQYGDIRRQAQQTHGLTPVEAERLSDRFENFLPQITKTADRRSNFDDVLPPGANWAPGRTAQMGGAQYSPTFPGAGNMGKSLYTQQRPYMPEFDSPDRQQFPVHRILANRYWRLFYKLDPVVGTCLDLYSQLPWSKFKLAGPGVEGSILKTCDSMCEETNLLGVLPMLTTEFYVTGEALPHAFFDQDKGYWTYIALHNPDQIEVIDAPFIKMDPILEFVPDDRLRSVVSSDHPAMRKIREEMPPELISRIQSRQNIPLSPVNATFIPRKLHPYDTRGTSIMTRLWRIFMFEDGVFNASIQTARRHASPLKFALLGNAQTGWIPGPEHEAKLLQLLAQAELDPLAWIVYHYGIKFEMIGTTDRIMSIRDQWETIERIKLIALGISKSFLTGEVTYASAATGLQVFLQRLKAFRSYIEQKWIRPKLFQPVAEINGWIRRSPAEVQHRFRIKRSQKELLEERRYIVPEIVWEKSLDPTVDAALVNAMQALEQMGVKFSKTSKMATVGFSFEEETRKLAQERDFERQFLPKVPQEKKEEEGGGGGMGLGGGEPPPPPPGGEEGGGEGPPPAPGAGGGAGPGGGEGPPPGAGGEMPAAAAAKTGNLAKHADNKKPSIKKLQEDNGPVRGPADSSILKSRVWVENQCGNWHADEVEALVDALDRLDTSSALWFPLTNEPSFRAAVVSGDRYGAWDVITVYLRHQNYPEVDIEELRQILVAEQWLPANDTDKLQRLEDGLDEPKEDNFLIGADNVGPNRNLSGDISTRLAEARRKAALVPESL